MNPHHPGCVAHLDAGQEHPIQSNEDRDLDHDGEASSHRIDLFFPINSHHFLLHLLRVVLQTLAHFGHFRIDGLHLRHTGVSFGIEPVKRGLQQQDQRHDRPTPVADKTLYLVQQPVEWFGQNREPAVILHQLEAGGKRLQHFFFLRTSEELGLQGFAAPRCNIVQGRNHAHCIQIGVDFSHEQVAFDAIAEQPGAGEIVLHHRHIAVFRRLFDVNLVLFNISKLYLLVFLGLGIDRWTSECGIERGFANRLVAVPDQLQVELR